MPTVPVVPDLPGHADRAQPRIRNTEIAASVLSGQIDGRLLVDAPIDTERQAFARERGEGSGGKLLAQHGALRPSCNKAGREARSATCISESQPHTGRRLEMDVKPFRFPVVGSGFVPGGCNGPAFASRDPCAGALSQTQQGRFAPKRGEEPMSEITARICAVLPDKIAEVVTKREKLLIINHCIIQALSQ